MSFASSSLNVACRRARTWISRSMDDDLDEASRLRLNEHIGSCAECRRHQEILLQGRAVLRGAEAEPSDNFEWKVQLGIQKALRERASAAEVDARRVGFWRPAVASAAAVALLVIGAGQVLLPGDEASSEQPDTTVGAARVVEAAPVATPDLSGGVPGTPIEVDATGSGFGIRTVGSFGDRFKGDLYDPMRSANPHPPTIPSPAAFRDMMRTSTPGFRPVLDGAARSASGVQILNWQIRRARIPASATVGDSMVESGSSQPR